MALSAGKQSGSDLSRPLAGRIPLIADSLDAESAGSVCPREALGNMNRAYSVQQVIRGSVTQIALGGGQKDK